MVGPANNCSYDFVAHSWDIIHSGWIVELEDYNCFGLGMFVLSWELGAGGFICIRMGARRLAVFLRQVIRLICLVSDLLMGGHSLVMSSITGGCAIGQIFCASRLYLSIVLITSFVALSMWSVAVPCLGSWS